MLVPTKIFYPGGDNSRKELKQSLYKNTKIHFYSSRSSQIMRIHAKEVMILGIEITHEIVAEIFF